MGNSNSTNSKGKENRVGKGSLNSNLLRHVGGDVLDKYEVITQIGMGSMGAISKAKIRSNKIGGTAYQIAPDKKTLCGCFGATKSKSVKEIKDLAGTFRKEEVFYALKTIVQSRISTEFIEELRNEIDIIKSLDHPNIAKAFEVFEHKSQIHIVLELCSGGDLYKRLPHSEKQAASISGKIFSAIAYMHSNDVVHRDLKFENIMWENDDSAEIKIIDFGLSKKFIPSDRSKTMSEGVGTIYTMAPQVLQGVYTSQADVWSIGVMAFMLLSSSKPFHHKKRRKAIDRIMRCDFKFRGEIWNSISDDAKDLVRKLIVLDPKERLNAKQALKHQWFQNQFSLSDRRPTEESMQKVEDNLVRYRHTSVLKRVALNVIARKSTAKEIRMMRNAFDQFDSMNDGIVTYKEFKLALKESNYSEKDLEEVFESIDVNSNGFIVYTEFLAATIEAKGAIEEERIAEAFDRMDTDSSGYISQDNLRQLLGDEYSKEDIESIIEKADENKDGKLSFQEFKTIFKSETERQAAVMLQDTENGDDNLVGLDANIPGGKHDSAT